MAVLTTIMNSRSSIDDAQQASSSVSALHWIDTIDELVVESETKKKKNQDHDIDIYTALAVNKKMVQKYQAQFPNIPTMRSKELVERWQQHDREDDERDNSIASSTSSSKSDSTGRSSASSSDSFQKTSRLGPFLLLLDVRSKAERAVCL